MIRGFMVVAGVPGEGLHVWKINAGKKIPKLAIPLKAASRYPVRGGFSDSIIRQRTYMLPLIPMSRGGETASILKK
jgi:hypothetical protein